MAHKKLKPRELMGKNYRNILNINHHFGGSMFQEDIASLTAIWP
jgi:hypothetical protein